MATYEGFRFVWSVCGRCGWYVVHCGRYVVGKVVGNAVGNVVGNAVGNSVGDVVGNAVSNVVGM